MNLGDLLTDTVSLLKKTGEHHQNLKASVQKNQIFIQGSNPLIEPGDLIQRTMPIRLLHIAPSVSSHQPRMASCPLVQLLVGRCRYPGGNFQYTLECH
jgi:hypothetical protein